MSARFSLVVLAALGALLFAGWASAGSDGPAIAPLPAPARTVYRIAFGSCANEEQPQPIWTAVAAEKPDLFLFVGDNVYADKDGDAWIDDMSPAAVGRAYETLAANADFAGFRAAVPILAIWDDHDYGINDAGREVPFKAEAKELMLDFFAVPDDAPVRARPGAYQAATFGPDGRRVQIILLDTRWFRSELTPTDTRGAPGKERYVPSTADEQVLLGAAQWAWLEERLREPADVRLLISSIQVVAEGHGWERWGNLPRERERLFDLIRRTHAENLVLLSGDRHVGGLYRLQGAAPYPLYEITSSSLNYSFARGRTVAEFGPHQLGHLYGPENFGLVTVDWDREVLSLELKDADGATVRAVTLSLDDLAGRED